MDYKESGVDVKKTDKLVGYLTKMAMSTHNINVLKNIGLFSSFYRLPEIRKPVLVSSCDGVGTKIDVAVMFNKFDTIGQDLVAMCVNDVITCGADPLYLLDYYSADKIEEEQYKIIMESINNACFEAGCSLIGGETAEMPGFYLPDRFDLAGFCLGIISEDRIIDGSEIKDGDSIIGIHSNGIHSNGYSLIRKVFAIKEYMENKDELLAPTFIYVDLVKELLNNPINIKGMAHITGGGIYHNINRIIPHGLDTNIYGWEIPDIFTTIRVHGNIMMEEMIKVFNMGIGYVLIVDREDELNVMKIVNEQGHEASVIGEIINEET